MRTAPPNVDADYVIAGETTLFDSLARLVPEELQTAYYRVLAHTRTLGPDDEMLWILEAMGVLALITCQTPKEIADERGRLQDLLSRHQELSDQVRLKFIGYLRDLDARISKLPREIEAGLNPKQIAHLLGESLRQHFLQSGIADTVEELHTTVAGLNDVQKSLRVALRNLSDSGGVLAQIDIANSRLNHSLENRAKAIDKLLCELRTDLLHIWIPLMIGCALLIGMFTGMGVQGCRDAPAATSMPIANPPQVPDTSKLTQDSTMAPKAKKNQQKRGLREDENSSLNR